jgi:preprotein translocase subunit SecY
MSGFGAGSSSDIFLFISSYLGRGTASLSGSFAAMIIFFGFFYTGIVFNPDEQAENLRKYGGFIPGIRPGENTFKAYRLCFDTTYNCWNTLFSSCSITS